MNRTKQIMCLALVFMLLGGCAGMNKHNKEKETEHTSSSSAAVFEETQSKEALQTVTSEISTETETVKTTKALKTTAVTTKANVTRKQAETTRRAETKASTVNHTEAAPTAAATVTTNAATTSPAEVKDGVIIGMKNVRFGCDRQDITSLFGAPSETVTEKLTSGGTVESLVYAEDYGGYAVFRLLNGRLFGFYTCVRDTLITDGESSYSLRTGGETEFGNIKITVYTDSKNSGEAYAFKASFSGFDYLPGDLESLAGQERLIFHTTNAIRAVNGLSALEYSEKASGCVREHCEDMSARNYFSHDTPEGVSSAQRMKNSGIEYGSCGENLAAGYLDAFGMADGWYNSSGHRKNMLDSKFGYLGVGVARGNESYDIYAGQNYYG